MNRSTVLALIPLALAFSLSVVAGEEAPKMSPEEQAMMEAFVKAGTPGAQHARMAKAAGSYTITVKSWQQPGTEPTVDQGSVTRRVILDGRVMVEEMSSSMGGQPFSGFGLSGYNNVTGKHWSTWNDSMSTGLMVAEGDCDEAGACRFTGSWDDPISKAKINARMTSSWNDADTETFAMFAPGPDGKEFQMMEISYRRQKP